MKGAPLHDEAELKTGTRILGLHVRWLYDERVFFRFLAYVDEERRRKALAYRFREDRAASLGAGLLLHFASFCLVPDLAKPLAIRHSANGKPYFAGDKAPRFNLSHAGEYVILAIGREEVGVDIAKPAGADEMLARRCFTSAELARVMPARSCFDADMFFRFWTLKESYLKFIGTGLSVDPLRIEIRGESPITLLQDGEHKPCSLRLFKTLPNYSIALCQQSDAILPQIDFVDEKRMAARLEIKNGDVADFSQAY